MAYEHHYEDKFKKEIKLLSRFPKRLKQVNKAIKMIIKDPYNCRLEKKKLQGRKHHEIRYYIGMNYRITILIDKRNNMIYFSKLGKRENFY